MKRVPWLGLFTIRSLRFPAVIAISAFPAVIAACQAASPGVSIHPVAVAPAATPVASVPPTAAVSATVPPATRPVAAPVTVTWPAPEPSQALPGDLPVPVATGTRAQPSPAAGVTATPVPGANSKSVPEVVPDTVLVTLAPGSDERTVLAAPGLAGFARKDALSLGSKRVLSLRVPAGMSLGEAIEHVRAVPGVARAGTDAVRRRFGYAFANKDPRYGEQWAHRPDRCNTELAWTVVPPSAQTRIIAAVLDTGLDVNHPEFAGRIQGAQNFTAANGAPTVDVTDAVGHGTHVTGILAAAGDNGVGVAGVAWGVQILPVKVLDDTGAGDDFQILKGFNYAVNYVPKPDTGARVRVINMSLGGVGGEISSLWTDAVATASQAGIVVVSASGNAGEEVVASPANTPDVVAVGSTANYLAWETLSSFSNYGDRLDLTAPGDGILSTVPTTGVTIGRDYAYDSGTSMASPFVAGVAALVAARYDGNNQQLTATFATKIRHRLFTAVDDLGTPGRDPLYGEGRINAGKAVSPATIDDTP